MIFIIKSLPGTLEQISIFQLSPVFNLLHTEVCFKINLHEYLCVKQSESAYRFQYCKSAASPAEYGTRETQCNFRQVHGHDTFHPKSHRLKAYQELLQES